MVISIGGFGKVMDLSAEADINKLKAMTFDEQVKIEQAQGNLQVLV